MITDSKRLSGACACGREHTMTTEFCVIESGAMRGFADYAKEHGLHGRSAAIYDENTYRAAEDRRPKADCEIILPPDGLHADEHGVAMALERIPKDTDYLVAVGSGTVHDITRYSAYKLGIPFASCPTAASVDGFCSSVAAMTWYGFKKTFTAVSPKIVVAELDIISKAPARLTASGVGDMIGKYIALAEWRIGNILTGEYLCESIYRMTLDAAKEVTAAAEDLAKGETHAYEKLMYGLVLSGLAMQLLGNSRCASGAEHHISHLIEMRPDGLGASSDALHGEKVGVGTLIASKVYHGLSETSPKWHDCRRPGDDYIAEFFGERLAEAIITENKSDVCAGITAELIESKWSEIREVVGEIPTVAELLPLCSRLGMKSSLEDIGVPSEKLPLICEYSPLVRNRLTLMRLRNEACEGMGMYFS